MILKEKKYITKNQLLFGIRNNHKIIIYLRMFSCLWIFKRLLIYKIIITLPITVQNVIHPFFTYDVCDAMC